MKPFYPCLFLLVTACGHAAHSPGAAQPPGPRPTKVHATLPDTLNQTDAQQRRQGRWHHFIQGKATGFVHYQNNVLHGHFKYKNGFCDSVEGMYENGRLKGPYFTFHNDSIADMVTCYKNGKGLWYGFPLADYVINLYRPIKGFHMQTDDSTWVSCPFIFDGPLFYEGLFVNQKPCGIHRTYYRSGELRYKTDYTGGIYIHYDRKGKILKSGKFVPETL